MGRTGRHIRKTRRPDMAQGGGNTASAPPCRQGRGPGNARRCSNFAPDRASSICSGRAACTNLLTTRIRFVAASRETIRVNELGDRAVAYVSDGLAGLPQSEEGQLDLVPEPAHFASADASGIFRGGHGRRRADAVVGQNASHDRRRGWRLHAFLRKHRAVLTLGAASSSKRTRRVGARNTSCRWSARPEI